jgi:acetolactate synthase I/III small subunit
MRIKSEPAERHTLSVLVDDEAGILARVSGMFTARGYNIESLTVAHVTEDLAVSRITIVTSGSPHEIEQIVAQLDRLVPVHRVVDLTAFGPHVERELALVKVAGTADQRIEARRLADLYGARIVDETRSSFVFEVTESTEKVNSFIAELDEYGLVEVARTGVVAISRGDAAA